MPTVMTRWGLRLPGVPCLHRGTQLRLEDEGPLEIKAVDGRAPSGKDKVHLNAPLAPSINCRNALKAVPLF